MTSYDFLIFIALTISIAVFILVSKSIKTAWLAILSVFNIYEFNCGLCGHNFITRIDNTHEWPAIYWNEFKPIKKGKLVCSKCAPLAKRLNFENERIDCNEPS
jgi:hypothetical protein